jgi:uncharacterized protein with NRDE domain
MCLILLAHDVHPTYRLVVAANRDELYARPTEPAGFWDDAPGVLAGRDLTAGGTWMGITRGGRFAAVTNYRDTAPPPAGAPSRGHLVGAFLRGDAAPAAYLEALADTAAGYAGFNLLVGDGEALGWISNRGGAPRMLRRGVYGLSNALLDTPWPKVVRGKSALRDALAGPEEGMERALFAALRDEAWAPDEALPDTGVGIERERALSSLFIVSPEYGTRASTVLLVARDGRALFVERRVTPGRAEMEERRFELPAPALAPAARGGA